MGVEVVSEASILDTVRPLVAGARERVWVTAPWVTSTAADLMFGGLLGRLRAGEALDVRVVYRLKGADDLTISDLTALDRLAAAGCQVRYSNRLHAKLVLVDDDHAVVSSSNLTATAGYAETGGRWQNEELGLHLTGEADRLDELAGEFERIWDAAEALSTRTVGLTLDSTTARSATVACVRAPVVGEFVTIGSPARSIGVVRAVTAYNPTVPALAGETDVLLGLRGGGGGRRSQVPDVATLFSHPSKTHAFLMAETFVRPDAAYHLAEVEILRAVERDGRFASPLAAAEPGDVVTEADPDLLDRLIAGSGHRLPIGHLPANPDVSVSLDRNRLLDLHCAVLGMTGAGKSNAVKVLIERLRIEEPDLRIVVIDTHGEYDGIDPAERSITVRFLPCTADEQWVRRVSLAGRQLGEVMDCVEVTLADLGPGATRAGLATALRGSQTGKLGVRVDRLADAVDATPELCFDIDSATVIEHQSTRVDWSQPGLYRLDLLGTHDAADRIAAVGGVARKLLDHAKATAGTQPILLVVDEAQNYAPEQQTGRLSGARDSFEPLFEIATEGRKFHCGLLAASQRPARVNKDILSQCNTQLIFRMVSAEDLDAVRGCFEGASQDLLDRLPGFDTGICFAGGAALAMGVQVAFPLAASDTTGGSAEG